VVLGVLLRSKRLYLFAVLRIAGLMENAARGERVIKAVEHSDRAQQKPTRSWGFVGIAHCFSPPPNPTLPLSQHNTILSIAGEAIHPIGASGGSIRLTTILDLEVEGDLCEDSNETTIDAADE
jgi:hypothetical protein